MSLYRRSEGRRPRRDRYNSWETKKSSAWKRTSQQRVIAFIIEISYTTNKDKKNLNWEMIFLFGKTDRLDVNTIRTLSVETVQKANPEYPGLPMSTASMAYAFWAKHLKVNPTASRNWVNHDRFILSADHGSAILHSLLRLSGCNVTTDDLKNLR